MHLMILTFLNVILDLYAQQNTPSDNSFTHFALNTTLAICNSVIMTIVAENYCMIVE